MITTFLYYCKYSSFTLCLEYVYSDNYVWGFYFGVFVCLFFKFHLTVLSKELKKELWHECVSIQEILLLQPL